MEDRRPVKSYFVSDVHLSDSNSESYKKFITLLNKIKNDQDCTHLFLMGDIFDLWIGSHEYFISKYKEVVDLIAEIASGYIEVHYFEGNHDLYLNEYWPSLNVIVHDKPIYTQLGEKSFRIEHGDQMDPRDTGYKFLRWFLRTKFMYFVGNKSPEKFIVWLGENSSKASRKYTSEHKTIVKEQAKDIIRNHAKKVCIQHSVDFVLSGHVHQADDYSFARKNKTVRSINLGTWLDDPQYAILENNKVTVVKL